MRSKNENELKKERIKELDNRLVELGGQIGKSLKLKEDISSYNIDIKSCLNRIGEYEQKIEELKDELKNLFHVIENNKKSMNDFLLKKGNCERKMCEIEVEGSKEDKISEMKTIRQELIDINPEESIFKEKNKGLAYCVKCGAMTKHENYPYESSPFGGFGGGVFTYSGLKCEKCGTIIYESDMYKRGMRDYNE